MDDFDPILLLLVLPALLFFIGMQSGKTGEHERQRRLAKIRGRINNLDPAEVTDYRLGTIEDVLPPTEK